MKTSKKNLFKVGDLFVLQDTSWKISYWGLVTKRVKNKYKVRLIEREIIDEEDGYFTLPSDYLYKYTLHYEIVYINTMSKSTKLTLNQFNCLWKLAKETAKHL